MIRGCVWLYGVRVLNNWKKVMQRLERCKRDNFTLGNVKLWFELCLIGSCAIVRIHRLLGLISPI